MEDTMVPIPAGALLTITSGEYSDYSVHGVFRALALIDVAAEVERYLAERPEQREDYAFDEFEFIGALARQGMLEGVDSFEMYLGSNGCADRIEVTAESARRPRD